MSQKLTPEQVNSLILYKETVGALHEHLKLKNRFPHPGQIQIIKALFKEKKKTLMIQCGRKFAKTESAIYCAWRFGLENPGSLTYIIAPTRKQGKDIYWIPRRLQGYGPRSLVEEERDSELAIVLKVKNSDDLNSKIIIEGSDNIDALRGINPDFVIYEEFRDHSFLFDLEVMRPNMAAKRAPLMAISTPPDKEGHYTDFRNEVLEAIKSEDNSYFYLELPTESNPVIDKSWLEKEKKRLYASGQASTYEREYNAKFIPGGASAVLPMWQSKKSGIIKPKGFIEKLIEKDKKRLNWYSFSDPAQSCFAVLHVAHNPYTSQLFVLDGIYEKDRMKTSAGNIWPRVMEKCSYWYDYDERWEHYYDPAASWFQADVFDRFGVALSSVKKLGAKQESQVSLIKDIICSPNTLFINEEIKALIWEWDNWCYKDGGELPDKDDHMIDLMFYILKVTGFSVNFEVHPKDLEFQMEEISSIEEKIKQERLSEDIFALIEEPYIDEFGNILHH